MIQSGLVGLPLSLDEVEVNLLAVDSVFLVDIFNKGHQVGQGSGRYLRGGGLFCCSRLFRSSGLFRSHTESIIA